jgi:hypothetical protein
MPTVIVRHKVGNFDTWIKGHQERVDLFTPAVSSFKTFQDADDPNSVVMVFEVADMDGMQALVSDPANDAIKERHTVLNPITVSMQVDV